MRRILRKIVAGEEDSLGDISTVSPKTILRWIKVMLTCLRSSPTRPWLTKLSNRSTLYGESESMGF